MRKDIMLCFLSDVKMIPNTDKISIAEYQNIGEQKECHTTNESAVRYLLRGENPVQGNLSKLFLVRSQKVAGVIAGYKDKNGKECAHYDYFRHRVSDVIPDVKDITEAIDFNENVAAEENMNTLIEVADRVRCYAKEVRKSDANAEIVLHVDCTGGLRNASMILVALMRLLQYERISIGKVLYSNYDKDNPKNNRVEEVNPLYSFFDLVAGAEEFVRHGEVSVMSDFFKDRETSVELKALLAAMRNFAKELKLCHYGDLRDAIDSLRRAITEFQSGASSPSSGVRQSDELMRQMLDRIQDDYDAILTDELDDIALIRWCLSHNLLQQAMTLFTERVPELLVRSDFVKIASKYHDHFEAALTKDSMNRNRGFYLLNEYKSPDADQLNKERRKWKKEREAFFNKFRQNSTEHEINAFVSAPPVPDTDLVQLRDAEGLREFLLWLHKFRLSDGVDEKMRASEESQRFFQRLAPIYSKANTVEGETKEDVWETLLTLRDKGVVSKLVKCVENMGIKVNDCEFLDIEWKKKAVRWLYEKGFIVRDEALAEQIFDKYFAVKVERNHTSHARAETGRMDVEKLKNMIETTLQDTEKACEIQEEQV